MADPDAFQSSRDIFTEVVTLERLIEHETAWNALVMRALEPNAFLDPAFAIPLYRSQKDWPRLRFLLVWHDQGHRAENERRDDLLGLLPISASHVFTLRFAGSKHTPLGIPLLDRELSLPALSAMADGLRRTFKHCPGLKLTDLPEGGATAALLQRYAATQETPLVSFNSYERACLYRTEDSKRTAGLPDGFISAKRRKFYRQQRRRLEEGGTVAYRQFREGGEIVTAAEAFLDLEARGWKGRRKTAFLDSASEAEFFRSAIEAMERRGSCRIDSLELAGAPIAMGVILESGERAFFWKTCFDERFAALSPGAQLTLELTRAQLASASVVLTDSCAVPDHPMINHIWRQRLNMTNLFLPIRPGFSALFRALAAFETTQASLRQIAKIVLRQARRLRRKW